MLPSLAILVVLSWIYVAFDDVPVMAGLFYGIKPAVTAIVLYAAWRIGTRVLKNGVLWAIATLAFVAIFALQVPFRAIVAAAALALLRFKRGVMEVLAASAGLGLAAFLGLR